MQASQYGAGDCVMCKPGCWHQIQHEQQIHGCENNNKNVVNLAERLEECAEVKCVQSKGFEG